LKEHLSLLSMVAARDLKELKRGVAFPSV